MGQDRAKSWYLAQLKPNARSIAERNLRRQGFDTFLPMEEVTRPRGGRFVTVPGPLFPGYIFVAFDPAAGAWRRINSTYGISRLVSFGPDPAPVPADLVARLMEHCDGAGMVRPAELPKVGARVRVTAGPFADTVAEIVGLAPERRVWVLLEILGGTTRVAVGAGQLRAV